MVNSKRIARIGVLTIVVLFILFSFVFVRFDLSKETLEATYFTADSHYADVTVLDLDGNPMTIQMHYQDLGEEDDPVIVLLHGAFASSHTFLPWAETLKESGFRVILPDLPYYGLTDRFDDNITSLRRSAAAIYDLLALLEIDSIHIGGNSMGGGVSWYFTSEHPDMVQSLLLIDAVYPSERQDDGGLVSYLLQLDLIAAIASKYTPKFLFERQLASAYGDPDNFDEQTLNRYYELLRKDGTRQSILQVRYEEETGMTGEERLELIRDENIPVLVMWGRLDAWIPLETATDFYFTLNLSVNDVVVFDELGHVPMEEDPDTVISYLLFLLH